MRKLIGLVMLVGFCSTLSAQNMPCRIVDPKPFQCEGETYITGTSACDISAIFTMFCHESLTGDFDKCLNDRSPKTQACLKNFKKVLAQEASGNNERCTWGFAGARTVTCDGKEYCFGTATCSSGIQANVFCSKDSCGRGAAACNSDYTEATHKCYSKMVSQGQPVGDYSKQNQTKKGHKPSGTTAD